MSKYCPRCKLEKDSKLFPPSRLRRDGLHSYCRSCCKDYDAESYQRNKDKHRIGNNRRRRIIRDKLDTIKATRGCLYCDESDPCCLDFHHREKAKKAKTISALVGDYNLKSLAEELSKCDVLCANCHRKLHKGRELVPRTTNDEINVGPEVLSGRISFS